MINWMISSSILILAIIILRYLFKGKISLRLQYALWLLVAARLLIPINFGSSLLSIENITNKIAEQPSVQSEIDEITFDTPNDYENAVKIYDGVETENLSSKKNEAPSVNWRQIGIALWIIGAAVVVIIFIVSNRIFANRLKKHRKMIDVPYAELPVYATKEIETPCLFGLFHPCIYVTDHVAENQAVLRHCIYHEMTHDKHNDLSWSVVRCICIALHWYNPLVWLSAILSKRDAELACDEATILRLGEAERTEYGKTLIQLTSTKRQELFVAATTMTGGKNSLRERIILIARKPKVRWYAILLIALISLAVVGCTFTNAAETKEDSTDVEPENISAETDAEITNAERIISKAAYASREGYTEARLTYVDNAEAGWNYYSDNPWNSDEERDALAQAAIKELYTLTGFNVEECVYTTDGRSRFIFGKSAENIRKSIAFYSRDYGFTLCGDSTPYMGFVNARRVHYSDVQQLDSPYNKAEYSGHAAIPTWFLEHSGVYQGEKIKGYDAFNLDDTVFTHIKLFFDGGYYVVVMDEEIESVSEVMGPYPSTPFQ